jgi:heat shock protein HslJ
MPRSTRWFVNVGSLALVVLAALIFAAISFAGGGSELDGTHWTLTQLNGQPPLSSDAVLDLSFQAEHRLGGYAGCNSYGGVYAVDGRSLTFRDLISTLRACAAADLNTQEGAYLHGLERVAGYTLVGDTLTLQDASGAALLVFVRA